MRECYVRILAVLLVLLVVVPHAVAQPMPSQMDTESRDTGLIPLRPYTVDIYDGSLDDPWSAKLSRKTVSITAVFCVHPDANRYLATTYAEDGFNRYKNILWGYQTQGVCEYTTHEKVSPFRPQGEVTIELEGSSENFIGPGRHSTGTKRFVFMRVIVESEVDHKPDRTLYIAVQQSQIDQEVVWPGI